METRRQGLSLMTALCLLIGTLLVIQLWLVAASLDALYAGDVGVLVPAALVSLGMFAVNGFLLWYGADFDRRLKRVRRR
ncbi:MAG TPA: DUF6755 family protein [Polyangia bacterium]|jgi:hypothetical protein